MSRRFSGIDSKEGFGTLLRAFAKQQVSPTAIATAFAAGVPLIGSNRKFVFPGGIPSAEQIGSLKALIGIKPSAISSLEAVGAHNVYIWSPALLPLTAWWKADYSSPPWVGSVSLGTSGSHNLVTAGDNPTAGAAQNGHIPIENAGPSNTHYLTGPNISTLVAGGTRATTRFSGWVLYSDASEGSGGQADLRTSNALLTEAQSRIGFHLADFGSGREFAIVTSATTKFSKPMAFPTLYGLARFRWNPTTDQSEININNGSWLASTNHEGEILSSLSAPAGQTRLFRTSTAYVAPFSGFNFLHGRILEFGLSDTFISDADFTKVRAYLNLVYSVGV